MVEERREIHRERTNERKHLITSKEGDLVMGRVTEQSKKSTQRVGKLVYQSKGPFIIVKDTGHSSYLMRRCGKPNSSLRKYMTQYLYLLTPTILLCEYFGYTGHGVFK